MKTTRAWHLGVKDVLTSGSRQRSHLRRLNWVIVLLCLLSIFVIGVYKYWPRNSAACHIFFSDGCSKYDQVATVPSRELTDEEIASQVVVREILMSPVQSKNPKIAFMFLTPGPLSFEMLWDKFFQVSCYLKLTVNLIFSTFIVLSLRIVFIFSSLELSCTMSLYESIHFLQGHQDKFTVYVHASREQPTHVSPYFVGQNIRSEKVDIRYRNSGYIIF